VIAAPDRRGAVRLPDGRRLAWAEWGSREGAPVLFFTGAGMSCALGFGADALPALEARLIAVDRPGVGGSDPDPGRTLDTWVADVAAFAAARGLEHPRMVGFSQGAPFALACAARGLTDAVAIVSGQDDLTHPALRPSLDPQLADLLDTIAHDPQGFEAWFAGVAGADFLWNLVIDGSSPPDREIYTSAPLGPAYRRALADGFAQGPRGYVRGLRLTFDRWPFQVEDVHAHVDLWYGAHDASAGHSPDLGATLARRLPHAERHLVEDAGGSLLWTHAAAILRTLLAHPRSDPRPMSSPPAARS
jgi:pimeloyl-ACP methyl ester carboxylesterase